MKATVVEAFIFSFKFEYWTKSVFVHRHFLGSFIIATICNTINSYLYWVFHDNVGSFIPDFLVLILIFFGMEKILEKCRVFFEKFWILIFLHEQIFGLYIFCLSKSNRPECSVKRLFFEIPQSSQKSSCARVFCKISKNTFYYRTHLVTASAFHKNNQAINSSC